MRVLINRNMWVNNEKGIIQRSRNLKQVGGGVDKKIMKNEIKN